MRFSEGCPTKPGEVGEGTPHLASQTPEPTRVTREFFDDDGKEAEKVPARDLLAFSHCPDQVLHLVCSLHALHLRVRVQVFWVQVLGGLGAG